MIKRLFTAISISALVVTSLLATARPVQAGNTITVTTFEDKFGGSTHCSLREAIQTANEDVYFAGCKKGSGADTIVLQAGTYFLEYPYDLSKGDGDPGTGDLDITSNLTIIGQGAGVTVIEAKPGFNDRMIHIQPASGSITVNISNLTIHGGSAVTGDGGGIKNDIDDAFNNDTDHANLILDHVTIDGNQALNNAGQGGGIFNGIGCSLSISNSTLSNNQAILGGGILNYGTLLVDRSDFNGNRSVTSGDALEARPYDPLNNHTDISNSTFSANGNASGNATIASNGRLSIQDSQVTGNAGIGISNSGEATIRGTTISINQSTGLKSDNPLTIENSSITHNNGIGIDSAWDLTLTYSTVALNLGDGIYQKAGTSAGTLTIANAQVNENRGTGLRLDAAATATLTNTSVTDNNTGALTGGAGVASAGNLTIQNSTIAGNTGIGLKVDSDAGPELPSITHVTNSTIAGKMVGGQTQGVGIDNAGELDLLYVTLADAGTGLQVEDGSLTNVQNTIITRNSISNCTNAGSGTLTNLDNNLFYNDPLPGAGTCIFNGAGYLAEDPLLAVSLAYNGGPGRTQTYALGPGSPAIDAVTANGAVCLAVDQRLLVRPVGSACDIGAYEFGSPFFTQFLPTIAR